MPKTPSNLLALIQARMGATRLPNKMLLDLHGYPVVQWVVHRLGKCQNISQLIVTIPETPQDDPLAEFLESIDADVFRGSETDVLNRMYQAATKEKATHILRVCADNPLLSPPEIDRLIKVATQHPCDYAYCRYGGDGYVDGIACAEYAPMKTLTTLETLSTEASHREHVFGYLLANRDQFQIVEVTPNDPELSNPTLRLDLDTLEDYTKLQSRPLTLDMEARQIIKLFAQE